MKKKDTSHTIFRSAAKFFSGTLLSRVSGMLRDMSIAYAFGTESALATFFIAFRFSHLARRLFGEGSLPTAFIPCFEELRLKDEKQAHTFFFQLAQLLALGLFVLICIAIFSLQLLSQFSPFSPDNQQLISLTCWMLPSLLFICLYGLNTAYLECEKSFFTPSIAPIAFNVIWIVATFYLMKEAPFQAMQGLSLAVVIGCFAQWGVTLPKVLSSLRSKNVSFFGSFTLFSPSVRSFIKPLFLANIGVAASQVNNALDPLFARSAALEGPAWLWYAIRLQQLPLSLFGIALAGALLPPLSRAAKAKDYPTFFHFLDYSVGKSLQVMIPLTFATLLVGQSAVNLIFGRGHFVAESILGTTYCLWGYSLGLVPMSLILLLAPSFYALGDYHLPVKISLLSVVVNILLNGLFVFLFKLGAESVAIATSAAAWINCAILLVSLYQRGYRPRFIQKVLPTLAYTLVASVALLLFDLYYFQESANYQAILGQLPTYEGKIPFQLQRFVLQGAVFLMSFAGALLVVKRSKVIKLKENKIGYSEE
ncbi:MAG: murein biosynthesis integral membrane protein MurJ [Parachlamydiaceae bacterium]